MVHSNTWVRWSDFKSQQKAFYHQKIEKSRQLQISGKMVDGLFTSKKNYGLQLYGKVRMSVGDPKTGI